MIIESLESRRLFAGGLPLNAAAQLIGLDRALTEFPQLRGANQTIAVIDTGIDYNNPLLGGGFGAGFKVLGGFDFVDNDVDPMDDHGHGTAIAGLIAGAEFERNGFRHVGIAPDANLVALRIGKDTEETPNGNIAAALQWVIDNRVTYGITAVNISFGSGHFSREPDDAPFATLLAELRELNIFVAAASGNGGIGNGEGIDYPAADVNVASVGSVDAFDTISEFTERGQLLDLLAPGENLSVLWINNTLKTVQGTSFAAPIITAASVLLREANSTLTPREILSVFQASGDDNVDGDDEFGPTTSMRFSRLDIACAIALATDRAPAGVGDEPFFDDARGNALAYDKNGILHTAWYDADQQTLQYATRTLDGQWSAPIRVDPDSIDAGRYLSLAVDSAGRPGIAYFDATNGDLRYARWTGEAFTIDTVDSRQSVGLYASMQFNTDNQPVIAYYHRSKGDLRAAEFVNNAWRITDIDANVNDRGRSVSMARNSIGRLGMAYEDSTTGKLKFAKQTAVGWTIDTIDESTNGVSFISAAFDPTDRLAVSYYDAAPADLKFAIETEDRSHFEAVTVARKGAVGLYSNVFIDSEGVANILYYSRRDDSLQLARGTINRFVASKLHSAGGRFSCGAVDPNDQALTYTWFNSADAMLQFESLVT